MDGFDVMFLLENTVDDPTVEFAKRFRSLKAAWPTYYELNLKGGEDQLGYAIRAMKEELIFNGHDSPVINVDLPLFGKATVANTITFQKEKGLEADGVIGPHTALVLLRKRAIAVQEKYGIPNNLVCKQKTGESANDPNALGPDGDTGPVQIIPKYHPDMTLWDMVNVAISLDYCGSQLLGAYTYVGKDWIGALAAWNIGWTRAKAWVQAGKPATGGATITIGGKTITVYEQATNYTKYILSCAC